MVAAGPVVQGGSAMKHPKHYHQPRQEEKSAENMPAIRSGVNPAARNVPPEPPTSHDPLRPHVGPRYVDPLDYTTHPYPSMRRFAEHLALGSSMPRTRHCYYRDLRLVQEHFSADPAGLTEDQFRGYILHVKTRKQWQPKTIRQTAACGKRFFVDKSINTTMIYMHLTHRSEQDSRALVEQLCGELPR